MLSIPISKTKIIPPSRRPQLLTRKRLLEFMYEALDKKLTLIHAPAGYGKTSLLIDLVHDNGNDLKYCWLTLDELDCDPQRFASYFISAIAERFPKIGGQSKSILDQMKSFEQSNELLLVTLVNETIENINEHFVIILDDFHLVDHVQSIQSFVNRFMQLMGEHCHLVIASRRVAELPDLSLWLAHNYAKIIEFTELAFSPQELQALIAQNENKQISDKEAKRLITDTEGWITGLQFSSLNNHSVINRNANLSDYFLQQVLNRQTPDLRKFILRTALFDEFDANLCEKVLTNFYPEKQDWRKWIQLIAKNNIFALPLGEQEDWLRYHHLFRDFIREQFQKECAEESHLILSNLQKAYESFKEWEKAYQICLQLDHLETLTDFVERSSGFMLQRNHSLIETWLNKLPTSLLKTRPILLSVRGALASLAGGLDESLNLLNQAEQKLRAENNTHQLALTLSRRAYTLRNLGEYVSALKDTEEFIELTSEDLSLRPLYAEALRTKGITLMRIGDVKQALSLLEKSLFLYEELNEKENITVLLADIGAVYRMLGDFEHAKEMNLKALQNWQESGNYYQQADVLNSLGFFYHMLGQYEDAVFAFEEGLWCAQKSNHHHVASLISIGLGDLYTELEEYDMAKQCYQRVFEALERKENRVLKFTLTFSEANLKLFQKDVNGIRQTLEAIKDFTIPLHSSYGVGFFNLMHGRLAFLENQPEQAVVSFKKATEIFSLEDRTIEANIARVWYMAALCQIKQYDKAVQIVKQLPTKNGNFLNVILVAMHQSQAWILELKQYSKKDKLVHTLFSQAEKFSKEISFLRRKVKLHTNTVFPSNSKLKIQSFGNATVYIKGKPLTISDWQTQSVRELFFYFLSMSKPQTKEQIGATLWPDIYEASKLRGRFKNEIFRLRRAVGQETILYDDVMYSFNTNLDYDHDIEAFEYYLSKAESSTRLKQKIDLYKKAVQIVQGPYLADIFSDWTIYERERLKQKYSQALQSLAELYLQDGDPENCVGICERAISHNASDELIYRIAMRAYHRKGDRASIIRIYQAYKKAIESLYGLPPSLETEALYQKLIR